MRARRRTSRAEFFIAAFPSKEIADDIHAAFDPHRDHMGRSQDRNWKTSSHYHVTLMVMGSQPIDALDDLERIVSDIDIEPFDARITHCDTFFKRRKLKSNRHVLWAGFDKDGARNFEKLYRAIESGLRVFRYKRYRNPDFVPHLTVARPQNNLQPQLDKTAQKFRRLSRLPTWHVQHVSIMQRLPRHWARDAALPTRFHELARLNLETGRLEQISDVILSYEGLIRHLSVSKVLAASASAHASPSPGA